MKLDIRVDKYRIFFMLYGIFYVICFSLLEKIDLNSSFYIIHTRLDERIPFFELFIIPYLSWFLYAGIILFYVTYTRQGEKSFKNAVISMVIGTGIFLVLSVFFPNAQDLRPEVFARENIFVDAVRWLYEVDTPTNVFPSLHVYVSVILHSVVLHDQNLKKSRGFCYGSGIWATLIVLSTMFLKQHSVIDVMAAILLAFVVNRMLYREPVFMQQSVYRKRMKKKYSNQWN